METLLYFFIKIIYNIATGLKSVAFLINTKGRIKMDYLKEYERWCTEPAFDEKTKKISFFVCI